MLNVPKSSYTKRYPSRGAQPAAELPPLNVCIRVNVDDEDSKGGIALEAVPALAAEITTLPNLRLRGLMAIPRADSGDNSRGAFRQLAMTDTTLYSYEQPPPGVASWNEQELAFVHDLTAGAPGTNRGVTQFVARVGFHSER